MYRIHLNKFLAMGKFKFVSVLIVIFLMSCASGQQSYKPKYKKPDPNKPIPCPMKDC